MSTIARMLCFFAALTVSNSAFAEVEGSKVSCPSGSKLQLSCTPNPKKGDEEIAISMFQGTTTLICDLRGDKTMIVEDGAGNRLVDGHADAEAIPGGMFYTVPGDKITVRLNTPVSLRGSTKKITAVMSLVFPVAGAGTPSVTFACTQF